MRDRVYCLTLHVGFPGDCLCCTSRKTVFANYFGVENLKKSSAQQINSLAYFTCIYFCTHSYDTYAYLKSELAVNST